MNVESEKNGAVDRVVSCYECLSCGNQVSAKEYKSYAQVKAGYPARCKCSYLQDVGNWKKIYKDS